MSICIDDKVKVDIKAVKKFDSVPPYIAMVRKVLNQGEPRGTAYVLEIEDDFVEIGNSPLDRFIGGPSVPISACEIYNK